MIQEQATALGLAMFSLLVRRCTYLLKESAKGKQMRNPQTAGLFPAWVPCRQVHNATLPSQHLFPLLDVLPLPSTPPSSAHLTSPSSSCIPFTSVALCPWGDYPSPFSLIVEIFTVPMSYCGFLQH